MTQRTVVTLSFALFVSGLLWGGYTLIVYLGIPVHELVYSTQEEVRAMDIACGSTAYVCRGAAMITPFVIALFKMASPFFLYAVLSLLAYAALIFRSAYKTGSFSFSMSVRPLVLVLLFIFSVWLLATTFSMGSLHNAAMPEAQRIIDTDGRRIVPPFNRFYEPVPQVYAGVGPQGMAELQANYQSLLDRGCLTEIGMTQNGAKVFTLGFLCMQQSFFTRVGVQIVMVLLFLVNLLVVGRLLLRKVIRIGSMHPLAHLIFSFGIGALAWVCILWTLAVFSVLQTPVVRILFFGMPLLLFMETRALLLDSLRPSFELEGSWKTIVPFLGWLLLSYLALNFLNVVRPFPIGWDDLGSYLNRPRLLASYGSFIAPMSQFQWEYLTSLGFLLFGYDSWHGSTFAMEVNWAAGLLAVLVVYGFARMYFGRGRGLLAAMCYYFLPMTGHFSFADMKIDNAVFFAGTAALLAACLALFPTEDEEKTLPAPKAFFIAGLLAAFAFAIKPTAVLSILFIASITVGALLGVTGYIGAIVTGFGVLQYFGALNIAEVARRALVGASVSGSTIAAITIVIGLSIIAYALHKKRSEMRRLAVIFGMFALGLAVPTAPWMVHNYSIGRTLTVSTLLTAPDRVTPQVFTEQKAQVEAMKLPSTIPVKWLPEALKLDPAHPACKANARAEELDRYWGFDFGIAHYLTLPWRQVMNIDAFGYYVTLMPALLLFPLLLLLPAFWEKRRRWLRLLFVGTFVFLVQWALVANGIPWYGIGMFFGFAVALEAFIAYAPDPANRRLFSFLIAMGLAVCIINRLWQFDSQKNIFEYPLGKISASALREITIPNYDDIRASVLDRHETLKETPYTYRIGTFISYFIPRNREILPLADHQLTFFNCLNQERDHALTLKRLVALGFNSIIFDTNTQTIEKDPNGSLHQKVEAFVAFANNASLGLNIIVNDPGNGIAYILLPVSGTGAVQ